MNLDKLVDKELTYEIQMKTDKLNRKGRCSICKTRIKTLQLKEKPKRNVDLFKSIFHLDPKYENSKDKFTDEEVKKINEFIEPMILNTYEICIDCVAFSAIEAQEACKKVLSADDMLDILLNKRKFF